MRVSGLFANAFVMATIGALSLLGAEQQTRPVVPLVGGTELTALEESVALTPDAHGVFKLASAYLDRGEPGLATAALERATPVMRTRPEVRYAEARSLFGQGRVAEALAASRALRDTCDADECAPWLSAKTARQVAFLEEVDAAGIEDPAAAPEATRQAYERSLRRVYMVAMR
jgi:hypothetical protein